MRLLDHHPRPEGVGSDLVIPGLSRAAVATTAHLVAGRLVFVAVDHDRLVMGLVDAEGEGRLLPVAPASPELAVHGDTVACLDRDGRAMVLDPRGDLRIAGKRGRRVVASADGRWAALHLRGDAEIWDLLEARRTATLPDTHVLGLDDSGQPSLTLAQARTALAECPGATGALTLRGSGSHEGTPVAWFDSLYGTAVVVPDPEPSVRWLPGEWVTAGICVDGELELATQRLERSRRRLLPGLHTTGDESTEDEPDFRVDEVISTDGVGVPVSRFRDSGAGTPDRVCVTVHGGFGLRLRPFSGVPRLLRYREHAFAHVRGGAELGADWATQGRGDHKLRAVQDLRATLAAVREGGRVHLVGASHGGWLALVTVLRHPGAADRVCITAPILDLVSYLDTGLGRRHRAEFPTDDVEAVDPTTLLLQGPHRALPELMIVAGKDDSIVSGQDPERFATAWRAAGGVCSLVWHQGGHYVPAAAEIERIEEAQAAFLQDGAASVAIRCGDGALTPASVP